MFTRVNIHHRREGNGNSRFDPIHLGADLYRRLYNWRRSTPKWFWLQGGLLQPRLRRLGNLWYGQTENCCAGKIRGKTSLLTLVFVLAGAMGLFVYGSDVGGAMLVRSRANGVGTAVSARANSLNATAIQSEAVPSTPASELTDANFQVRGLAGKCITAGKLRHLPGDTPFENNDPVFLYDCNGTTNQQVRVVELVPGAYRSGAVKPHEVQLRAADKCIGAGGNFIVPNVPLLLQDCNGSRGQIFALDGDSILFAQERSFVVEVRNARSQNATPLVVGERGLDDSEFWSFTATGGSDAKPTSGFVRATNALELFWRLQQAAWGTVIEVDSETPLNMQVTFNVPAGVTIRGDRRRLAQGAELYWPDKTLKGPMLAINGDQVRITGLRLRGPSRNKDYDSEWINGILAPEKYFSTIDHNELYDWRWAGVYVSSDSDLATCPTDSDSPSSRLHPIRVARNFFHHNQMNELGYGVGVYLGAYPLIEGNTFVSNRHAIAADGEAHTGYSASRNLVLADAPQQSNWLYSWYEHDFDMHGYVPDSHNYGGIAGWYTRIAGNTFLGTNRDNFGLRGKPCYLAEFHNNVSLRSRGGAIDYYLPPTYPPNPTPTPPAWLSVEGNQFESPNPTDQLGVGDFDGDGKEDTFLATGAAWYYAPGGQAEWRYLNNSGTKLDGLLLGDFDGDGRTDVLTQSGRDWRVSWGGISRFSEKINTQNGQISDYHVGNFDGDQRADVFYANGSEWFLSLDGTTPFTHFLYDTRRTKDLRFGDFNGDGHTDVFGVVGDDWMVVYGGTQYWSRLRAKLTNNVNDVVVADFNADGRADVATSSHDGLYFDWRISSGGWGNWSPLQNNAIAALKDVPAIGRFDISAGADVLFWPGQYFFQQGRPVLDAENYLDIASSGVGVARHSLHDMR